MGNNEIKFEEIKNENELLHYLKESALKHTYYKIYSKYDRIENILNTHAVYLSKGEKWNDIEDKKALNNDKYEQTNFAICFSCRHSEDVAMWMLYSGKSDGCMVDFRKDVIKSLLSSDKIVLGQFCGKKFKGLTELTKNQFDIYLSDIVYYKKDKNYNLKHSNDKLNSNFESLDFLKYFKKKRPWIYENECRLVVTVDKSIIPEGTSTVKIEFDKGLVNKDKIVTFKSPTAKNTNINYSNSKLENDIDWDLCYDCNKKSCSTCEYEYKEIMEEK